MTKKKCFCGKKSLGNIGLPVVQLTESQRPVNVEEGQSSLIMPLCIYHSVLADKGVLKTDGKQTLKPEPLAKFELHKDDCLMKHIREGRGEDPEFDKHLIEIILSARKIERNPKLLERFPLTGSESRGGK